MDDEEICSGFDGFLHGGEGRVHRRGDAGDGTVVADLESVVRAVVVAELGGAKGRVAVTDNSGEWGGGRRLLIPNIETACAAFPPIQCITSNRLRLAFDRLLVKHHRALSITAERCESADAYATKNSAIPHPLAANG